MLRLALGLQLGGALGNLLDRLQQGYVTDFLDVGPWPIFNVADSAISVGMVLMVWYFFTHREEDTTDVAIAETASASNISEGRCQRSEDAMEYGADESNPMPSTLKFDLDGDGLPIRIDLFIRHEIPELSRTEVQRQIRSGAVRVNGRTIDTPSAKVNSGDLVEFDMTGSSLSDVIPVPQNLDFRVVYDDEHIIVVDKPAGMSVHAGAGRSDGTLVNGLLARYPELADLEPVERPGIVHRLDADTSGLMVVARTSESASALSAAIKAREVDRRYVAMVVGKLPPNPGVIDRPVGRHPTIRTRQAVVEDGRPARTRFAFVAGHYAFGKSLSMVNLKLETGRTHQIRVHMEAIGYPIVGDPVYGVLIPELPLRRQFLHANQLGFDHPITGERLSFRSPLPPDLAQAQARIGPPSSSGYGSSGYSAR